VNDANPQRRRFQFSLRTLMLWMVVVAVYLAILRLLNAGAVFAVSTTVWLAVLVVIRLKWGSERGAIVATLGAGPSLTAIAGVGIGLLFWLNTPWSPEWPHLLAALAYVVVLCLLFGTLAGLSTFLVVDLIVRFVNWLDRLMQTKMPQGGAEESKS
jgi:hypothetical protein